MKYGVALSQAGVRALAESGRLDLVVARGPAAVTAARGLGLETTAADALFDTAVAEEVDRMALVTARR